MMQALLIDLENYPKQANDVLKKLENYSQVILFYAQHEVEIPLDWLMLLTDFIKKGSFRIVRTSNLKKNNINFSITFWIGFLMSQLPKNSHFDIISNNAELDFVLELLDAEGYTAKRIGAIKDYTLPKYHSPLQEYCLHLFENPNKPLKETSLLNSIRAKLNGDYSVDANVLLAEMVDEGLVAINEGEVSYDYLKLSEILKK